MKLLFAALTALLLIVPLTVYAKLTDDFNMVDDLFTFAKQLFLQSDGDVYYGYDVERANGAQPTVASAPQNIEPPQENIEKLNHAVKQPLAISLDAPLINQNPELPKGCEVTSLTMLLQYAGFNVDKLQMAEQMLKDETPPTFLAKGVVKYWGNPNDGFVGDVTGKKSGFGIYHKALFPLLKHHIHTALDMTGSPYERLERKLAEHKPVVVWTTGHYGAPKKWVEWDTPSGLLRTTFEEHAVLLVGYDEQHVYINDPLSVRKQHKINKAHFRKGWEAMGSQALSY
jgi:uncharacterized protein YvpB